jgi:hypothetical protein
MASKITEISLELVGNRPSNSQYVYSKLDDANCEIRLVTLLPSPNFEDPIRITISHVLLDPPSYTPKPPVDEKAIKRELPEGWEAVETLEGRVLYQYFDDKDIRRTTWTHPTPHRNTIPIPSEPDDCPSFEPTYEALSYTWGSSSGLKEIYVDDLTENRNAPRKTIRIHRNLENALRYLRCVGKARMLWIDALCINQLDLDERSAQVQRMAGIFKYANRVIVWLGMPSSTSAHVFCTLSTLGSQVEFARSNIRFPSPLSDAPLWDCLYELPYDDFTW